MPAILGGEPSCRAGEKNAPDMPTGSPASSIGSRRRGADMHRWMQERLGTPSVRSAPAGRAAPSSSQDQMCMDPVRGAEADGECEEGASRACCSSRGCSTSVAYYAASGGTGMRVSRYRFTVSGSATHCGGTPRLRKTATDEAGSTRGAQSRLFVIEALAVRLLELDAFPAQTTCHLDGRRFGTRDVAVRR